MLALWENSPLHNKALQWLRVAPEDCKNGWLVTRMLLASSTVSAHLHAEMYIHNLILAGVTAKCCNTDVWWLFYLTTIGCHFPSARLSYSHSPLLGCPHQRRSSGGKWQTIAVRVNTLYLVCCGCYGQSNVMSKCRCMEQ